MSPAAVISFKTCRTTFHQENCAKSIKRRLAKVPQAEERLALIKDLQNAAMTRLTVV